jgi:GAF domain-containing protein
MDGQDLAAALAEAARTIGKSQTLEEALQTIVETAQMSLPGFDHVGISTVDDKGKISTRAATSQLVWDLDSLQYTLEEGPCIDSMRGHVEVVQAPWIRHNRRWLKYVPRAVDMGLQSQLAVQLYLDDEGTVGGLNMYSTESEEIDPNAVAMADLFATHAALALGKVRAVKHLNDALRSREIIGKAVGLVMAKYDLDEDAAFGFLARTSSHANVKVRDIAARMVEEHAAQVNRNPRST